MDQNELDYRINLIKEELEVGRLKLSDLELVKSLEKVRKGSDGKVIPETVDARVRALANAVLSARHL